jgi:ribosomal protein L37AE/L43A
METREKACCPFCHSAAIRYRKHARLMHCDNCGKGWSKLTKAVKQVPKRTALPPGLVKIMQAKAIRKANQDCAGSQ